MPAGLRYGIGAAGGRVWYVASAAQRRAALANYAAVLEREPGDPEVATVARQAFANYGRMLADFMLMGSMSPQELIDRVTVRGLEHVDAALEAGRGCILAAPHMGSWDVASSYAGALGYPIYGVTESFPGSLNDAVEATRQTFGMRVIPVGRAAVRRIMEALATNSIVCLICDLPHGPGVEVQFFGRRATVPAGPAAFACKTGAALVPVHAYRTAPGRYHVHLDQPIEPREVGGCGGKEAARDLMQRVVRRFEDFIRERPEQWYAFKPLFGPQHKAA